MDTHLSVSQTIKTIMDSKHVVTLDDAHPDCCTDCSVHASAGSTDVHDGYVDVALLSVREMQLDLFLIKTNLYEVR